MVRGKTDPYTWIFSSVDNCYYNYNSRYLFEYVKEHIPEVTPYFVINNPERRQKLSEEYGEKYFIETESIEGVLKVLEAGVWFTSAGLPVYGIGLEKGRLIINLWHGVPLKKIALLDPNLGRTARLYFRMIFSKKTMIMKTKGVVAKMIKDSSQLIVNIVIRVKIKANTIQKTLIKLLPTISPILLASFCNLDISQPLGVLS